MAKSLKLSDSYYWDASAFVINSYNAPGSSAGTPTLNGTRTLNADFTWIDCGGFQETGAYATPPYFESIRGNTYSTMDVKFAITFSAAPKVVVCPVGSNNSSPPIAAYAVARSGCVSANNTSTTGFTYYTVNKSTAYDWQCGMNWIAVGKY